MEKNTICFAFVIIIPEKMQLFMSRSEMYYNQIMTSSTNVVILYGDTDNTLLVSIKMWESLGIHKIWITTSKLDVTTSEKDFTLNNAHGILSFAHHHAEIYGFKKFVQTLNPFQYSEDVLARLEWMNINCEVSASKCKTLKNCSSSASLEWLMVETVDMAFSDSIYDVIDAVYTVARAFHEMILQTMDNGKGPRSNSLRFVSSIGWYLLSSMS